MKSPKLSILSTFAAVGMTLGQAVAVADQVHLKNGNKIEGKVVAQDDESRVLLEIEGAGRMWLRRSEVAAIEEGEAAADEAGNLVEVKLKNSASGFYGSGVYSGNVASSSNDEILVLVVAQGASMRIPRSAIESISEKQALPEVRESEEGIETTHKVILKNGNAIRGNVLAGSEDGPVRVTIGKSGTMTIPRREVLRIEEATGLIPAAPAATTDGDMDPEVDPAAEPQNIDELKEQLKNELREELLDDLLHQLIEDKLSADAGSRIRSVENLLTEELVSQLSNDDVLHIQELVQELGRHRTRNRVRAENKLSRLGPVVLPFLHHAAKHPFDLTRRAVQRVVSRIDDLRGAPLAIAALNDHDAFVRKSAKESLEQFFPASDIRYGVDATAKARRQAQAAYWQLWEHVLFEESKAQAANSLAAAH